MLLRAFTDAFGLWHMWRSTIALSINASHALTLHRKLDWGREDVCGASIPGVIRDTVAGNSVVKTHPNVIAIVSLVVQALQLAAFPFNPTLPWPSSVSNSMRVRRSGVLSTSCC